MAEKRCLGSQVSGFPWLAGPGAPLPGGATVHPHRTGGMNIRTGTIQVRVYRVAA